MSRDDHIEDLRRKYRDAGVKALTLLNVAVHAERAWREAQTDEYMAFKLLGAALEEREATK